VDGLTWEPSSDNTGVAGYEIFRDGESVGSVTETAFTDSSAEILTLHTYTVEAYDADGNRSGWSTPVSVTMTGTGPLPRVIFSATPGSVLPGETVFLSWDSDGADSCAVEPDIGDVGTRGIREILPAGTAFYALTAVGPGGL